MEGFVRGKVPLEEGHLSYLFRRGRGPTLVLIPGSYSSAAQWDYVVPLLASDLALVLVELRGHGESWPPPRDGSIEQLGQDTLKVVDALDIKRFHIGGHSIGGMVSLEVARVSGERVKGVLCCEGWTNHHAEKNAFGGPSSNVLTAEQEAKGREARATVDERWPDQQVKAFGQIWRLWDGYGFLCETEVPILEIYGDRGREPASMEALHIPERPNITLNWIADAGHSNLPLVRPKEIAEAFTAFIRAINGDSRHLF